MPGFTISFLFGQFRIRAKVPMVAVNESGQFPYFMNCIFKFSQLLVVLEHEINGVNSTTGPEDARPLFFQDTFCRHVRRVIIYDHQTTNCAPISMYW